MPEGIQAAILSFALCAGIALIIVAFAYLDKASDND